MAWGGDEGTRAGVVPSPWAFARTLASVPGRRMATAFSKVGGRGAAWSDLRVERLTALAVDCGEERGRADGPGGTWRRRGLRDMVGRGRTSEFRADQ